MLLSPRLVGSGIFHMSHSSHPPISTMLVTRSLTLALIASSTQVGAFTPPKTSIVPTIKSVGFQHTHFEHSLNLVGKKYDTPIDFYVDETMRTKNDVPTSTIALIGSSLLSFAYVMQRLQIYLNTPCLNGGPGGSTICDASYYDFATYFKDHEIISFLLVLTHVIPFVLLPWVSKQVSEVGPTIQKDFEGFNPFIMQMAMACIGFGLSLEFGWHVADSWYYENNFHVLNFGFYFFLISGFALWADGFKNIAIFDLIFGGILAGATVLYPFGNAAQVGEPYPAFLADFFADGASSAKIPLYIGMSATFLEITRRGKEIFGNKMLWVPFFCIGVNLGFIALLNNVQYGNAEVVDGVKQLTNLNYIYHICHDVLGTEMGVLVFGLLIKNYVPLADRVEE